MVGRNYLFHNDKEFTLEKEYVSVIVPIYNNASCLPRCIESIMRQTYEKLQILLIDDGSKDESGRICDDYAKRDSRIEVYHLKNSGVSNTRNYALTKIRGEYVQFVDSDDFISKNMTKIMVDELEKTNSDMVVCNYTKVFQKAAIPNMKCDRNGVYSNKEYLCRTLSDAGHHYYGVVWNKMYRRKVIEENRLLFDEKVSLGEDFIFNIQYWLKCKSVAVIGCHFYHYNKSNDVTLSQLWNKKIEDCQRELENRKHIYRYYTEAFKVFDLYQVYKEDILFYWIVFYVRQKNSLQKEYAGWTEEERRKWKHQIENDADIRKSLQYVSERRCKWYEKKYQLEKAIKSTLKRWGGII